MTIYALATAPGRSGVAVVRISGARAAEALAALGVALPPPRLLSRAKLQHPESKELLDHGLAAWFPAPHSFTGEPVVELHLHGGRAIIQGVLEALALLPGLRLAEPGEFSRRAFMHGKLDLLEAEGLADVIDAQTAAQRRQALRQMEGTASRQLDAWRQALLEALAFTEASIDFPEEDIPDAALSEARLRLQGLAQEIDRSLADQRAGERIRDGLYIAIIGRPNVGKSSLLNKLAKRDMAIVADVAGTTRDVVEVALDLNGYAVTLADTAGIRETQDVIEALGVERARSRARQADLCIHVMDATQPEEGEGVIEPHLPRLTVYNFLDRLALEQQALCEASKENLYISVTSDRNMDRFLALLQEAVRMLCDQAVAPVSTQIRHREALQDVLAHLRRAMTAPALELAAEDMRLAAHALGRLTGAVTTEEVLGEIFSRFCIGK